MSPDMPRRSPGPTLRNDPRPLDRELVLFWLFGCCWQDSLTGCVPVLVRAADGVFEFPHSSPEGTADLRKTLGAEHEQYNAEEYQQLCGAFESGEHSGSLPLPSLSREQRRAAATSRSGTPTANPRWQ